MRPIALQQNAVECHRLIASSGGIGDSAHRDALGSMIEDLFSQPPPRQPQEHQKYLTVVQIARSVLFDWAAHPSQAKKAALTAVTLARPLGDRAVWCSANRCYLDALHLDEGTDNGAIEKCLEEHEAVPTQGLDLCHTRLIRCQRMYERDAPYTEIQKALAAANTDWCESHRSQPAELAFSVRATRAVLDGSDALVNLGLASRQADQQQAESYRTGDQSLQRFLKAVAKYPWLDRRIPWLLAKIGMEMIDLADSGLVSVTNRAGVKTLTAEDVLLEAKRTMEFYHPAAVLTL